MLTHLECTRCDRRYEPGRTSTLCECGGPLFARYDLAHAALEMRPGHLALREPTLWRYREVLPLEDPDDRVTLGEGFTPLVPAPRLGERLGLPKLLVKEEGGNPTGSFKARGLALAVSMARLFGATRSLPAVRRQRRQRARRLRGTRRSPRARLPAPPTPRGSSRWRRRPTAPRS